MRFEAFSQNFPLVMPGTHQFSSKIDRRSGPAPTSSRTVAPPPAGLTMRQRRGAFSIDPEPRREVFIISKPRRGLPRRGETPLSGGVAL
jgi:hypothetical protein